MYNFFKGEAHDNYYQLPYVPVQYTGLLHRLLAGNTIRYCDHYTNSLSEQTRASYNMSYLPPKESDTTKTHQ